MGTKIHNTKECGWKHITCSLGKVYGYNSLWHLTELHVSHVQIIQNRTVDARKDLVAATRQVSSTIMFGVIGNMLATPPKAAFDMELDIYTTTGKVIEIWTSEERLIKALQSSMHVKDPRDKFRRARGVK